MSSDVKLETSCKLDIACRKSKSTYRTGPSAKPCRVVVTSTPAAALPSRRYRSYSATLNRPSTRDVDDNRKTLPPASRKLSQQVNTTTSTYSFGDRLKRRHGSISAAGSFVTGFKRRKKLEPSDIVPPTKFLLGGNITDPLNLNSFVDEKPGSRQQTPDVSPRLPVPKQRSQVEVLIPPNINDPLNLNGCDEDAELESILVTPKSSKSKRKLKNKNRKQNADAIASGNGDNINTRTENSLISDVHSSKPPPNVVDRCQVPVADKVDVVQPKSTSTTELQQSKHTKKSDNKIVSPVIPQPGSTRRPIGHTRTAANVHRESDVTDEDRKNHRPRRSVYYNYMQGGQPPVQSREVVTFNAKNERFRYGNYNRYYGYRNPDGVDDYRLQCFKREWFEDMDVLDVGCNIGHITLSVARDLAPRKMVGIDIDGSLVKIARRNVVHYLEASGGDVNSLSTQFPISLSICCGPIAVAATAAAVVSTDSSDDHRSTFPHNVCFVEGNYVLESDELLEAQRAEFDTIICFSLTKWVHLNWGDDGLKRLFKRIFRQLRPGGRLILEAQAFTTYNKKKKLTESIFRNYQNLKFMPEHFTEYLLSKEVGFSKCEVIDTPFNVSKGFRRPIQLFTKGGNTPCTRTSSSSATSSKDDELPAP